jgi:hypothetical protein
MSPILLLPLELLSAICAYLPVDALLALKLVHRFVNARVRIDPQSWPTHKISLCARLAIRTYLALPDPAPTQEWCILCHEKYPTSMFCSSSSPICTRRSHIQQDSAVDVLELPPRVCCWHAGRLTRLVKNAPDRRDEWVSCLELMCMHCGSIQGWKKCHCDCDSCAFRTVCTYTRFLNKDTKYKSFTFWRSSETCDGVASQGGLQGTLYAREVHYNPGAFISLHSRPERRLTLAQTHVMKPLQ